MELSIRGLQAALGISQIKKLKNTINLKIRQGKYYQELLKNEGQYLETQLSNWNDVENHYWVFGVLLKENIRDLVMEDRKKKV